TYIKPFLGVQDNSTWDYLGATHDDRVSNLIQWVRGNNISGLRNRRADWDGDGDQEVWKLGDIVHSTPVTLSKPPDKFGLLYSDESYQDYYDQYKDRETIVYLGANDGMLHAFTSYKYESTTRSFNWAAGSENIGDELWAFIPQSLLPHLKWGPDTNYTHVYYVDMKPKVFDAKILPDETHYTDSDSDFDGIDNDGDGLVDEIGEADNWGTILLTGFNLGGGEISAEEDFDYNAGTADTTRSFFPTYVCMDITDPRNPRLLWERTYQNLQRTSSTPTVVKVKDKWLAVFGSGPSDCDGSSSQNGYVFVVDLKTGDAYPNASFAAGTTDGWLFETSESDAFMNSPVSLDKNMNYSVDAVYIGETYDDAGWKGKLYKIAVPWVKEDPVGSGTYVYDGEDTANYVDDPTDATNPWQLSILFDSTTPITAPAALSVDTLDNGWIFFGTGRYLGTPDKTDTDTQYLFGIKDPFFNSSHACYQSYSAACLPTATDLLEISDLLNADGFLIADANSVYDGISLIADHDGDGTTGEYEDLLSLARSMDGWMRTLTTSKERVITKPAILGGTLFTASFVPNDDICGFGGTSALYALFYETGTAYHRAAFSNGTITVDIDGQDVEVFKDKIELGEGKSSSVGIHAGKQDGATGFLQQSTGTILREELDPALKFRSGLTSWLEK
ncbi:MAG: hypothetical protein JRG75_12405, partial [Deltaproteobacteria bacterium]|nr:hypothetical protein [Deltaproteobacteria bacterium]